MYPGALPALEDQLNQFPARGIGCFILEHSQVTADLGFPGLAVDVTVEMVGDRQMGLALY
jgi:hypothetical protein